MTSVVGEQGLPPSQRVHTMHDETALPPREGRARAAAFDIVGHARSAATRGRRAKPIPRPDADASESSAASWGESRRRRSRLRAGGTLPPFLRFKRRPRSGLRCVHACMRSHHRRRLHRRHQHSGARYAVSFSDKDGGKAFPPVGALRSPPPPSHAVDPSIASAPGRGMAFVDDASSSGRRPRHRALPLWPFLLEEEGRFRHAWCVL